MGANHSNDHLRVISDNENTTTSGRKSTIPVTSGWHRKRSKVKPHPPAQLGISTVTHNSVTISWLPPRNDQANPIIAYTIEARRPRHNKRWQVVTKNCQSTSFKARHLESDTQYMFKVRAENIFGTGKSSLPSETVTTKLFEMSSDLNCYLASPSSPTYSLDQSGLSMAYGYGGQNNNTSVGGRSVSTNDCHQRGSQVYPSDKNLKRRHSFNVQLDGGVTNILNHSDVILNSSCSSSTSTIINGAYNRNSNIFDGNTKSNSLTRDQGHRTSLQPGRKMSVSAFLPGSQAQSMNRLRESRNSLRSPISDFNGNITKTALLSRDSSMSVNAKKEYRSSLASSTSDVIGSLSSKEDNRRSRGSRCSLLSSQSEATVSNSHDGSRHSDYSSSMDHLDTTDFGDSQIGSSIYVPMFPSLDSILNELSNKANDSSTLNDEDDEIAKIKQELRNIELTDEKLRSEELMGNPIKSPDLQSPINQNPLFQGLNYYDTLEDPWEKSPSGNQVSENIMAAPFSDDIKIALYARNISDDVTQGFHSNENLENDSHDFRTLRSVLQSDQTIVRPNRPAPDMVGVVLGECGETRTLTRGKLTTIEDADEEEDAVRVTTL